MNGTEPHYRDVITSNGQTIMVSDAACTFDSPPTGGARPPVLATNAPPASSASLRLPIMFGSSGAYVAVSIGTIAANMLVDTGAIGMTVSASIANQLIANGQATERPAEIVGLAGGVKQEFRQVDISSVTVGGHVVPNVHAGVMPDGSDMLLGLGVLAQVSGKFAINVPNATLDFDETRHANEAAKKGRPRIEERAKPTRPTSLGSSSKCHGGHGTAAKPRSVKAGSDPGPFVRRSTRRRLHDALLDLRTPATPSWLILCPFRSPRRQWPSVSFSPSLHDTLPSMLAIDFGLNRRASFVDVALRLELDRRCRGASACAR